MRVTADTNVVVSGLFWRGNPRRVPDAARDGIIELYTTATLLKELEDVLKREKFEKRLSAATVTIRELVDGYASLTTVVDVLSVPTVVLRDPDDDEVIACAVAAECELIVSGDDDLLSLKQHKEIRILTSAELLIELQLI
ncbi:MAG: putative toxin-antitoxin system toxin component, PIN family [Blastocatellia bacterium]|nr:putative toxin-antitoxin system toxin component, PIN family [Blastocatellia bacterium]